jgi:hypothetical protein
MNEELTKGTVVSYTGGWYSVRAVFKNTVNLGPVFGSKTTIKGVPKSEVKPDHDAWYKAFSKSEFYASM